ncbi:MAG TPA: hypothetical protein VNG11_05290, partial [Chloroflexota bacterium]|nr:hypothetical protein [Chloroflexota bacterium]
GAVRGATARRSASRCYQLGAALPLAVSCQALPRGLSSPEEFFQGVSSGLTRFFHQRIPVSSVDELVEGDLVPDELFDSLSKLVRWDF